MARPDVSVVMPFAGDRSAALAAVSMLHGLNAAPGDELILVDNSGALAGMHVSDRVSVVDASRGERSPARARNAGAAFSSRDWILFLDADVIPAHDLLERYFSEPVGHDVGALAGDVGPDQVAAGVAARYAASRRLLDQSAHLAHSFRPRAVAANLLVRRTAFDQVGGFYEGLRAAEDTDFSWRLQQAGWRLEPRFAASVRHRHRDTVRALRRQWRSYAAGRAWLARRYDGFRPEPALARVAQRIRRREGISPVRAPDAASPPRAGRLDRARFLALDAVLAADELAGFALSNRPRGEAARTPVKVVLVADRFPAAGDPLVELALTIDGARVESVARPDSIDASGRALRVHYREDDGLASRAQALVRLAVRHPLRTARDVLARRSGEPSLSTLAPAALRLDRDKGALVQALGAGRAQGVAHRLAALAGRSLGERRS